MESDPIKSDTEFITATSLDGSDLIQQSDTEEDDDSHTEGKPSPPPKSSTVLPSAIPPLLPAVRDERRHSSSTDTNRSTSPTRSKKRAIDTMLDGEEDKECIVMEKPPLPKRQTPPSPTKSAKTSSSSPSSPSSPPTFMDHAIYVKGDVNYEQACALLDAYRQHEGILETGAPILDFFDQWIREVNPSSVNIVDALFDLLLENYNPTTDEQLLSRIPLVMNQILQRKRKESLQQLFRVTILAVQLTLNHLSNIDVNIDYQKLKGVFDFLKTIDSFAFKLPPPASAQQPRAFSGFAYDKPPCGGSLVSFRFVLLSQYCRPVVFTRFFQLVQDYASLNSIRYPVLSMMTLIGEVSLNIFKCYKILKPVAKLKERLRMPNPAIDFDDNFSQIQDTMRHLGKFIYNHLVKLIRTESNPAILSVAQLTMTTSFLRLCATDLGPLDTDEKTDITPVIAAMRMTARLAFEGLATETKRLDLFEWSVSWYKRQIELDYGKGFSQKATDPDAVGQHGIIYVGEIFRDRHVLDYVTIDRSFPGTLQIALVFILFALRYVNALSPEDLDALYTRFGQNSNHELYCRAYWEAIRQVVSNFDHDIIRTILSQIQRSDWWKIYFQNEPRTTIIILLSSIADICKDKIKTSAVDNMAIIDTVQYLLRGIAVNDIDDISFRSGVSDILLRLFPSYPVTGDERNRLADIFFQNASTGPANQRGGDLQLLRALLLTEPTEIIPSWNRDDCMSRLCHKKPSLPELILGELAYWKFRQYASGGENAQRSSLVEYQVQFLIQVLAADKYVGGGYQFPRKVLEEFWSTALTRSGEDPGIETQFWGGDGVTETLRLILFHTLSGIDFLGHSGLDVPFVQFFIDEKLPDVNMMALKSMGWDFIVKGIEFLDTQLGLEYISTPLSLLWKIIREALPCSAYAVKFMTSRLLKANVPSFVHQQFVESAIDVIVEIGNRYHKADSAPSNQDLYNFKATFDTLSHFLNDYKKSVHEKDETSFPSSESDSMEIEDKKVIIARCTQTSGQKEYRDIQFSPDTTIKVFQETLASKLSLVRFRLFAQGREITRKESEQVKTLQEWGFKELEAIMIQVQERAKEEQSPVRKVSNCELWVSSRFDNLHHLLSGEPRFAYVVNRFLIVRPPEMKLIEKLRNMETPWEQLFSFVRPWDLHYTLSVLHHCVEKFRKDEQGFEWVAAFGDKYHDKIIHLVEWLSQPPLATSLDWPYSFGLAVPILNVLMVKCVGSPWLRTIPVERLIRAMLNYWAHIARQDPYLSSSVMNILLVLSAMDVGLWLSIIQPEFESLFFAVAVEHPNDPTREAVWTSFGDLFTYCSMKAFSVVNGNNEQNDSDAESKMEIDHHPYRNIVTYLWQVTLNCLKRAHAYISLAGKAFDTGANILRIYYQALSSTFPEDAKELLREISSRARSELFDHVVQESVLNNAVDYITLGWTRILQVCFDLMSPNDIDAIIPRNFSHQVISTFLFPALPSQDIENPHPMKPYCIHSETRGALFDLVFKLLDTPKRNVISCFVHSILETDSEVLPDDHYIDRSSWVQASSRLTGIHNLSNTCYMNSLVNQLFMNVDFRNFIFSVEVDDPEGDQNLLYQLRFLFARLQLGNDKAAYPQELAHAIIDFEGHPINIHVQMDVDEFFNLLFHRIEGQFKNNEERVRFRKLYGGVLRHTIKSRECEHVSSREEDFAAIQCDVSGKNTLEDSLASYVSGEMMEGDNKYSCEACGRHVDAVKQISIKSLPDNLIFHLKRFEYAFDIGKRIKVNDWFQFPREIDLFPYTMGHIEMQEKGIERSKEETEEIYELVGVLVHTGTAESGHYYSYIRDPRPRDSVPDPKIQWFEFNDSEVKPWRIEELDHWCFGGPELTYDPTFYHEPPFKSYSAYMLFYRKRPKALSLLHVTPKVRLPPPSLKAQVQRYNDYFIRRYVIFGEDLSAFVAKLLRSMPQRDTSRLEECEIQQLDDHTHDLYPLVLGLQVYRLVVSRMDFRSSVEKYCVALKSAIRSSPAARHYFYTWLQKTPGCLKELLLTNLNDKARSQSAQLIASTLIGDEVAKPRSHNPENGIDLLDLEVVKNVIIDLTSLVYLAGDNWRSWSEYFETLALIAKDPDWARLLIEENTIANCAYHFIHSIYPRGSNVPRGFGRLKYPDNDRVRPNFKQVVAVIAQLLPHVMVPPSNPTEERNFLSLNEPGLITDDEFELIFFEWDNEYSLAHVRRSSLNLFVHRLFETSCDVPDVVIIIKWMLTESMLRENMSGQKMAILNAIHRQADPTNINTGEALDVIWKLLEENAEENERWRALLLHLIRRIAQWSEALRESFYGQEYLSFWKMIYEYDDDDFKVIVINNLPQIASQLIFSNEVHVRDRTAAWLQSLVPKLAEDEEVETVVLASIPNLYQRLVAQTEFFLDRKIIITERLPSLMSVVVPVLQILRLLSATFPFLVADNIDAVIEGLQEKAKLMHEFDNNYFYGESEDEMEDMETDDEESIVEGSPYP